METKKNPSVDLTKKSGYFFSIGLFISTALAVMAFEWQQKDAFIVIDPTHDNFTEPLIDIPITTITPPTPVPAILNPVIKEVDDNEEAEPEIVIIDALGDGDEEEIPVVAPAPEEKETNVIFDIVEKSASPKDGMAAFYKYIGEKIKYPAQARRIGIEGKVFVEFVVNKDGGLTDIKTIKGIGGGCDEEAVRILESAPPWNPGKQRGKPVRQRYTLQITFKLG